MRPHEPRAVSWWLMVLLAVAVGVIAGLGAGVFRAMISLFHNLLFHGTLSLTYDASAHTAPSPWGALVILVPVVGAVGVAFLVKTFAPEARGHGVPEVIDSIWYHEGRIRPMVALIKSVASALSIGSGGSVGREGPIIQIGSAFGSTLGQVIAMPARQRVLLIAAGAGGGIAATFNTPVGGIVFAVELMLPAVVPGSLLVVAVATVTATAIGRLLFGSLPAFSVPALASLEAPAEAWQAYLGYAVLGVLIGLLATLFIRAIYWSEDFFDAFPGNYYTRHMLGMLLVGLCMSFFLTQSGPLFGQPGHYYVQGVGYATILDILTGRLTAPGFLLLLVAAKLLVTCLTLGSGASGGIFSPALFLGAALGACAGLGLEQVLPGVLAVPTRLALAGMAGMIAGTTGALLTAIVMVFEMTWDYGAVLPLVLTASIAAVVREALCPPTIYTLKLLRRGHVVPQGLQAWTDARRRAADVMTSGYWIADLRDPEVLASAAGLRALLGGDLIITAEPEGRLSGVYDAWIPEKEGTRGSPRQARHVVVDPGRRLTEVLLAMDEANADVALVAEGGEAHRDRLRGVITSRHLAGLALSAARLQG